MKNANAPAPAPTVPSVPILFIRPSIAFTPVVPRSTKNFSKSESNIVEDNCSVALLNCETLPEILSRYFSFSSADEPNELTDCSTAFSAS